MLFDYLIYKNQLLLLTNLINFIMILLVIKK